MDLVYGPVTSLRYGTTLGINLLGEKKVCSYNCIYCSLGPTELTMNKVRKAYTFPTLENIKMAFRDYIKKSVPVEAIVLAGNGEPTLYPDFEEAVKTICALRDEHLPGKKVIVLSSGAHLDNKRVVAGMNAADERVIKLDAGNDTLMQRVNDPLVRINLSRFLGGVQKLKTVTVQAMFFKGVIDNTLNEYVDEWIEIIGMIKPATIQICTLTRPTPLDPSLKAADEDTLYSIAFKLKKRTNLEASVFAPAKPG